MLKCLIELKVLTNVQRLLLDIAAWANKRDHLSLSVPTAAPWNVNSSDCSSLNPMLGFLARNPVFRFWCPSSFSLNIFRLYQLQNACMVCSKERSGLMLYRSQQAFLCFAAWLHGWCIEGMVTSSPGPITFHCYYVLPYFIETGAHYLALTGLEFIM